MPRPPSSIMSAAEQKSATAAEKKAAKAALKGASQLLAEHIKAKAKAEREHARNLKQFDAAGVQLSKAHERASKVAAKYTTADA